MFNEFKENEQRKNDLQLEKTKKELALKVKAEIEAIEKHSEVYMAEAVAMLVQTVFDV